MDVKIWRHCGSCKGPIAVGSAYYLCGIASCKKTAYCSVACFDDHVPVLRHKDAWAEEHRAPLTVSEKVLESKPIGAFGQASLPKDILVVASKLKDYIRAKSGLNTSANVLERLSDMIRLQCDKAVERAQGDGRKTVMDRDFFF